MKIDVPLELRKQLNFIIASCEGFDAGRLEEAVRIAVAARVLFHQTPNSTALLGGHYKSPDLKLVSTTMFKPDAPKTENHPLGFIGMEPSKGSFHPYLDETDRKEEIPLSDWWNEPIMSLLKEPISGHVTRRQLVTDSANSDGGAHVGINKKPEYLHLEDGLTLEIVAKFKDGVTRQVKLRYANLVALRQIGHEILISPSILALANRK